MFNGKLRKIGLAYVLLQAIIWVKCAAFYALYGYGRVMAFNELAFPQAAVQFNFFFHEAMHIGIGVLALLFGKNLQKVEKATLLAAVFAAVALHNVGYWLTKSHPGTLYSVLDFASDSALLLAFIVLGNVLEKTGAWRKVSLFMQKQKV